MLKIEMIFFVAAFFALPTVAVYAVPANPKGVELSQPDGTSLKVFFKGDEFYKWNEEAGGYTIFYDSGSKTWFYGEKAASGAVVPSIYKVGAIDPGIIGLKKHSADLQRIKRALSARSARNSKSSVNPSSNGGSTKTPILSGNMKNLVILARFNSLAPTYSQSQFVDLFNKPGYSDDGAVGSLKDYYQEISYNKLTIDSVVTQWVALPNSYAYYGANDIYGDDVRPQQMVLDAVNALAATGFDFSTVDGNNDGEVDQLTIIHSGRGEEANAGINPNYIWSHSWNLSAPVYKSGKKLFKYTTEPEMRGTDGAPATFGFIRVGVIAHETGHFLGLPDLYDTTYLSSGAGDFCLMASGSWGGGDGRSPVHMSAPCLLGLGWVTATQISRNNTYSLPAIKNDASALYKLRGGYFPAAEYFLVENRQKLGFDQALPGSGGILIWHVDENLSNNDNSTHYLADLEEAGGIQHLAQNTDSGADEDYFRSGNSTGFGDTTTPNSRSYYGGRLGVLLNNFSPSLSTMRFDAVITEATQGTLPKITTYPNPCYFNKGKLTIGDLPADTRGAKAYIYNVAGHLVTTLAPQSTNVFFWSGSDQWGQKAASGLYLYLIKTENYGDTTGKVYVFW